MSPVVIDLNCPTCGAAIPAGAKECEYCGRPLVIQNVTTILDLDDVQIKRYTNTYKKLLDEDPSNPEIWKAIGITQLKLGLYPAADKSFTQAAEFCFDDGDIHFYLAITKLGGKRPAFVKRNELDLALQELEAASGIEEKGIYEYLAAVITFDYFARKGFNIRPNYSEHMDSAKQRGYSESDVLALNELMKVDTNHLPSID